MERGMDGWQDDGRTGGRGREREREGQLVGRRDEARRGKARRSGYGRSGGGVRVLSRAARTRTTMGARVAAGGIETFRTGD